MTPRPYRILVTGSREWADLHDLRINLIRAAHCAKEGDPVVIVHGACPIRTLADGRRASADMLADELAREQGWQVDPHPAKWKEYGKAAGTIRNQYMVDLGAAVCLAFPTASSTGTWDCIRRANAAGIRVIIVPERKP